LVFIGTGNPAGFSHVNDIPRPLLDRLELVYMDLPDEEIEKKIMLKERFSEQGNQESGIEFEQPQYFEPGDILRKVVAPWWVIDMVNKAVRHSRTCPYVEKQPSIRATIRALDHTYASVEIENKQVANLRHAFYGLRLALRGRIGLRADLIDFEQPRKTFSLAGKLTEDFLWNVVEDIYDDPAFLGDWDRKIVGAELTRLLSGEVDLTAGSLSESAISDFSELKEIIQRMRRLGREKADLISTSESETKLYDSRATEIIEELNYSAVEVLANICVHAKTLSESKTNQLFIASEYE